MFKFSFFIVGVFKCGIIVMCKYFNRYLEIYIFIIKEIWYFDIDLKYKIYVKNLEEYLVFFDDGVGNICGEGSFSYFYLKEVVIEIYNFNLDVKIIIMLRELVFLLYFFYS